MLSAVVFPIHDKEGLFFEHLEKITPDLKQIYSRALVSITPPTLEFQKGRVEKLQKDPFFEVVFNSRGTKVGDHFLNGYRRAVELSEPAQNLHLCALDRLAFILETELKNEFLKDIVWAESQEKPVLFQRSKKAWSEHPRNYFALESGLTRIGEIFWGKTFDFVWCHLTIKTNLLKEILPSVKAHDFVFQAEMVFLLKEELIIKNVDWLTWEDPFIYKKDLAQFKAEKEKDPQENEKRYSYVIPVSKFLLEHI